MQFSLNASVLRAVFYVHGKVERDRPQQPRSGIKMQLTAQAVGEKRK